MQHVNYQTVKLGKGKHSSPRHGACVMELAAMLAGERFSDHPRSVSRPIAAFLRIYNDLLDDRRRQDLYEYAARTVGTTASEEVERARIDRLSAWGDEMWEKRVRWSLLERLRRRCARNTRRKSAESAARHAIQAMRKVTDENHALALALVDELVSIGSRSGPIAQPSDALFRAPCNVAANQAAPAP
jgi:hypothetical protein